MSEYSINLNSKDLATIAAGLGELPLKIAKPTFDKINDQVIAASVPPKDSLQADESAGDRN